MQKLYLKGLPDVVLTDTLLEGLHGLSRLVLLRLEGYERQIAGGNITAAAFTRSVRLHTHTHRQLLSVSA